MSDDQEVLFEEIAGQGGHLGVITLNRPQILNSLNQTMIHAMYAQLNKWAIAPDIKAVVIRAAPGRAFCAGGDLRFTYERFKNKDPLLSTFFRDEYQLNRLIYHFPKPYIALLDGITMGGGVGISIHGSHRVATDHLLFAMPETSIGFFPDVGGTHFLPRLPGKIGFYLGLMGTKLTSDDCVAIHIATQKIAQEAIPDLIQSLAQHAFSHDAKASVTELINPFTVPSNRFSFIKHQAEIDQCFSGHTVEDIVYALQHSSNELCRDTASAIAKKSPTSLKVTLRAMQQGLSLHFDDCMRQEYRMVCRFLKAHDFFEGIRAIIIDKDQAPQWLPSTIATVSDYEVEQYFVPLVEELV
ncbi:MAG: hypothetical protein A3F42_07860 [Gammaproteobacteria bacterium RIFCSPHIGHO2_12_FULL_37_34]|nr:MAG: hypothetical protein A3F42_07860 [Gammaproteobacteria bacterium RIFCSPHIGHO2_12_FULL_37_34]